MDVGDASSHQLSREVCVCEYTCCLRIYVIMNMRIRFLYSIIHKWKNLKSQTYNSDFK